MNKAHFLTLSEVNHVMHVRYYSYYQQYHYCFELLYNCFGYCCMFKETICVTIAEIKKINANKYGWIYDGCNFCTKGVRMDNGQLKCRGNHINDEAKPR